MAAYGVWHPKKSNATVTTPIIIYRNWLNGEIVRHIKFAERFTMDEWRVRERRRKMFVIIYFVFTVCAWERITVKGVNCQWKIDSNFLSAHNRTEINKHKTIYGNFCGDRFCDGKFMWIWAILLLAGSDQRWIDDFHSNWTSNSNLGSHWRSQFNYFLRPFERNLLITQYVDFALKKSSHRPG